MPNLDQQRAAYAWRCVSEVRSDDYTNLAKGAPALIMSNGLMQTLAFYQSKNHEELVRHIIGGVRDILARPGDPQMLDFNRAMERLHGGPSEQYMRATEEALEVLRWIRQFAAARKGA
jgi:CRISPR-associated protein Cmr5